MPLNDNITNKVYRSCQSQLYFIFLQHVSAYTRGKYIPGSRSLGRLNFVRWRLILLGPLYGIYFMPHSWRPEFWGDS